MFRKIIEESNASSIRAPRAPARVHAHIHTHPSYRKKKCSALLLHFASGNLEIEWNVLRFFFYIRTQIT